MSAAEKQQSWVAGRKFGMVPVDILGDRRLTLTDIRVFCALAAYANKAGECHPRRARITELTGLDKYQITKSTSHLAKLGWLTKSHSIRTTKYRLSSTPKEPREEPGVQPGEIATPFISTD